MNDEHTTPPEELHLSAAQMAQLDPFLAKLPRPIRIHLWGLEDASPEEKEAFRLFRALEAEYEGVSLRTFSRRAAHRYYPVIGVMGVAEEKPVDYGVRFIGLPAGYQINSLIAAMQAVAFSGVTLEPKTRLQLRQVDADVTLELITSDEDEAGPVAAKTIFGLAVDSERVKSYVIMSNMFPEAAVRFSAYYLPHLVINKRVHLEGVADEATIMKHVGIAVRQGKQGA